MLRALQAIDDARRLLADLEPGAWSADDAARAAEALGRLENAAGTARVKMAARAALGSAHRWRGFADTAAWMASATGSTVGNARRELDAAALVEQCPETGDALTNGDVSLLQAGEIARTEAEVPGCERELLTLAREGSLSAVRRVATTLRLEAMDRDALYQKQRQARHCSHWRDDLGMVRISAALTPDVGIPLVAHLDRMTKRLRRAARREGEIEPFATLAADAFATLLASPTHDPTEVYATIVIDWPALVRGHLHPGERSHIIGGGPIPPRVARQMMEHAFLKVVLTDGVEVQRVVHFGRRIPAELRTALELGPPPEFAGVMCSELGCERRYNLEWDHVLPVAAGGPTTFENITPKCGPHHRQKTRRDSDAGLLGPAGAPPSALDREPDDQSDRGPP